MTADDLQGVPLKNLMQAQKALSNSISRVEYVDTLTGSETSVDSVNFGDSTSTALSGLYDAYMEMSRAIDNRVEDEAVTGHPVIGHECLLFECPDCDAVLTVFENPDDSAVGTVCPECERPVRVEPDGRPLEPEEAGRL